MDSHGDEHSAEEACTTKQHWCGHSPTDTQPCDEGTDSEGKDTGHASQKGAERVPERSIHGKLGDRTNVTAASVPRESPTIQCYHEERCVSSGPAPAANSGEEVEEFTGVFETRGCLDAGESWCELSFRGAGGYDDLGVNPFTTSSHDEYDTGDSGSQSRHLEFETMNNDNESGTSIFSLPHLPRSSEPPFQYRRQAPHQADDIEVEHAENVNPETVSPIVEQYASYYELKLPVDSETPREKVARFLADQARCRGWALPTIQESQHEDDGKSPRNVRIQFHRVELRSDEQTVPASPSPVKSDPFNLELPRDFSPRPESAFRRCTRRENEVGSQVEMRPNDPDGRDATAGRESPPNSLSRSSIGLELKDPANSSTQKHTSRLSENQETDHCASLLYGLARDNHRNFEESEVDGYRSEHTIQSPPSPSPTTKYRMAHTAQYTALASEQSRPSSETIPLDTRTSMPSTVGFSLSRTQEYDSDSGSSTSTVPLLSRGCEPLPPHKPTPRENTSQDQRHRVQSEERGSRREGLPSQSNESSSIGKNEHLQHFNDRCTLQMTADLSFIASKSDNNNPSDCKELSYAHVVSSVNTPNEESNSVASHTYQDVGHSLYHNSWFGDNEPVSNIDRDSVTLESLGRRTITKSIFSLAPSAVRQDQGMHRTQRGSSSSDQNEENSSVAPHPDNKQSNLNNSRDSITSAILNLPRPSYSKQSISGFSIEAHRVDRATQTGDELESSEAVQSINDDHDNVDSDNQDDDDDDDDAAASISSTDTIIGELDEVIRNQSLSPNLRASFIDLADRLLQMNIKLFHPLRSAREPKLMIRESDANAVVASAVEVGTYLSQLDAKICDWLEACDEAREELEVISASVDGGSGSPSAAELEMTYHRMAQVVVR
jgi:hypothetical protein